MNFTIALRKSRATDAQSVGMAIVYVRCYEGKKTDFRASTPVTVIADYWDTQNLCYKRDTPVDLVSPAERLTVEQQINKILRMVKIKYKPGADAAWLKDTISKCNLEADDIEPTEEDETDTLLVTDMVENPFLRPKTYNPYKENKNENDIAYERKLMEMAKTRQENESKQFMLDCFELYLAEATFNDWHRQAQTSIMHRLQRYEKWIGYSNDMPTFRLILEDFDKEQVEDFALYMEHEAEYKEAHPDFFAQFNIRNPKWIRAVSRNSVVSGIKRLNMFLNWAVKKDLLHDYSFRQVTCDQQIYGTPYYLTLEERDKVYALDLSDNPRLETHRDKFIFQCHVGCRNNDLELFTWDHINGDFLEYVPHKNILAGRTQLVRCPLDETAKEILMTIDPEAQLLFAHYCTDWYRQDIKEILKLAGIDRKVMVFNPRINKAEPRILYEVAATHLARRTFIGNLYKDVKDPALIASLTGHTENSTSFNRYRTIDDDVKRDVLKYLE